MKTKRRFWVWWVVALGGMGCQSQTPSTAVSEKKPDNAATRYAAGLAAAPAKAQASVDKANRVIAEQNALMDRVAQQAQ